MVDVVASWTSQTVRISRADHKVTAPTRTSLALAITVVADRAAADAGLIDVSGQTAPRSRACSCTKSGGARRGLPGALLLLRIAASSNLANNAACGALLRRRPPEKSARPTRVHAWRLDRSTRRSRSPHAAAGRLRLGDCPRRQQGVPSQGLLGDFWGFDTSPMSKFDFPGKGFSTLVKTETDSLEVQGFMCDVLKGGHTGARAHRIS